MLIAIAIGGRGVILKGYFYYIITGADITWATEIPAEIYARLYTPWRRVRFEVDLLDRVFRRYGARRIVEYGCGIGRHGYLLNKKGYSVLLTDVRDWRYGGSRRLPFKIYDVLRGGFIDLFDAGYAMGLIIIFKYRDIVRVLKNIGENLRDDGVFIFDYNFGIYEEPERVIVRIDGKIYSAVLRRNQYQQVDGGLLYEYRVEVIDDKGNVVGVEDTSYSIYDRDTISRAIEEAGFVVDRIIALKWDPNEYRYRYAKKGEGDSNVYVIKKRR
jgi:SAM-dependent methyltransferase